ncbi:16709_t:CDS:2 [Acaulospora colombiana]|uniref:16709_t:CDS:1 n=1 Tax=Acaulospora colombiana TaxID=27376 RepID=A0ACA9KA81_9GLOM|nr:16709_t:CDS:2 [Acaulospora colombiana]
MDNNEDGAGRLFPLLPPTIELSPQQSSEEDIYGSLVNHQNKSSDPQNINNNDSEMDTNDSEMDTNQSPQPHLLPIPFYPNYGTINSPITNQKISNNGFNSSNNSISNSNRNSLNSLSNSSGSQNVVDNLFTNFTNSSHNLNLNSKRSSNIIIPQTPSKRSSKSNSINVVHPIYNTNPDNFDNSTRDLESSSGRGNHNSTLQQNSPEDADPNKENGRKGICNRLGKRKFCCICCGIFVLISIVMIPIAIFVIAPAIAQNVVNGSQLQFDNVKLSNVTEENFVLSVSGRVTKTGPLKATISLPDGVNIYWEKTLIGHMSLDPIVTKPSVGANIQTAQTFTILNKTAFTLFSKYMLNGKEFTWRLDGGAKVNTLGLHLYGIRLSKYVTMGGMQGFQNVSIDQFNAPSVNPDGGISIEISSTLVNPSQIGIEVGDIFFDVIYRNQTVGQVSSTNFTLTPGSNKLLLDGRLIPQNTSAGLSAVGDLFSKFITGHDVPIGVLAKLVRPNNYTAPISWLQSAFLGTYLSVILPGMQHVSIIHGVTLNILDLEFNSTDQYTPLASSSLIVNFGIPFGFPLSMNNISEEITVFDGSIPLATLDVPYTTATGNTTTGIIHSNFSSIPFKIIPNSRTAFSKFARHLTTDSTVSLTLKGAANSLSTTPVGDIEIKGISFTVQTTLTGLNGLSTRPTVINSLKVIGGTSDHMLIQLEVTLFNPSNVKISMPNCSATFDLIFKNLKIGTAIMPNFTLNQGENLNTLVYAQFSPKTVEEVKVGRVLLDNFLSGNQSEVNIRGNANSTNIVPLQSAMEAINLDMQLPGLSSPKPIITKARFSIGLNTLFDKKSKATIDLFNPLDTQLSILRINASVYSAYNKTDKIFGDKEGGELIGVINQDLGNDEIVIGIGEEITTREMELDLKLGATAIKSLVESLKGELKIDVVAIIEIKVGDYLTEVDYYDTNFTFSIATLAQKQIPTEYGNNNS